MTHQNPREGVNTVTLYRLHEADPRFQMPGRTRASTSSAPRQRSRREASFVISRDASQGERRSPQVARQLENAEALPGFKPQWDINIHGHAAVLLDY